MQNVRVHLTIEGRVQGVWFRDSTRKEAISLGLYGWVKNRPNGSVEVVAEGSEDKIMALVAWCRHGPPAARVSRIHKTMEEWLGEFSSFDIIF